jgi:hypothetical protein
MNLTKTAQQNKKNLKTETLFELKAFSMALAEEEFHNPTEQGEAHLDKLTQLIEKWEKI